MGELRILDKDLDRLANAETARLHSTRIVWRLGVALIFAATVAALGPGLGLVEVSRLTVAGILVAAFLALSIGANDVANALGPAAGAGAISMRKGLLVVGAAQIAGATLAGGRVSETLSVGILPAELMMHGTEPAVVMLAAMLGAAIWIALATWAGAPVSATHAIVGGIAGAGFVVFGAGAPDRGSLARIAVGWVVSPVLAGLMGALFLAGLRRLIHSSPNRIGAAWRWLPWMVGGMAAILTLHAAELPGVGAIEIAVAGLSVALITGWLARRQMLRLGVGDMTAGNMLDRLFGPPLVLSAVMLGFSHGANDVANIAAPLSIIAQAGAGLNPAGKLVPLWMLATGGAGIALGAVLFGRRLVHMVGSRITRLNTSRALCAALATSVTVLSSSRLGLPVSTTHVAIGAVFGVGFYREWERRHSTGRRASSPLPPEEQHRRHLVRRAALVRTLAAWMVTLPAAGSFAAGFALLIG